MSGGGRKRTPVAANICQTEEPDLHRTTCKTLSKSLNVHFLEKVTELLVSMMLDIHFLWNSAQVALLLFMALQYQVRAGARADGYNDENDQVSSAV